MGLLYRFTFRLVLVAMIAMAGILAHKSYQSVEGFREVAARHQELTDHIEQLKQGNAMLTAENERLISDFAYYEQLGREVFGMVKPDEVVYIVDLP